MPAHRKPLRLRKFLVATVGVAVTGAGVAFAAQEEPEPVRSAPEPPALTSAPSGSTTPSEAGEADRSASPSRSAHTPRARLHDKAKDKPSRKPSPTESSEPTPTPTPEPEPTRTVTRPSTPKPAPTQQPASGSGILGGTNAARANAGLPALSVSSCLTEMAQRHAERLAAAGTLYHQNLSSVMSACGMSTAGENVAMNYSGPADMVDQWLESPGHRANMLSGRFTLIGVGTAQARDGSWYGVQVFGAQ